MSKQDKITERHQRKKYDEQFAANYGGGRFTQEDEAKIEGRLAAQDMQELTHRYGAERTLKALIAVLEEMGDLDNIFNILRGEMQMQEPRDIRGLSPRYGRREDFNEY